MKVRLYVVFFLLLTLFSCTNRDSVPSGILVPDSMRVVMHDLIIADQFVSQYLVKDSLTRDVKKESQEWYEKMFAVHGTTREAFRKSLDYYATRPDLEKIVFDSLANSVTQERALIYKEKYGLRDSLAKRRADSVAKAKAGPPPLNPDTVKKEILLAHPGIPMAVLRDSVQVRMKIRATQDSLRNANHIRDSTHQHYTDSVHMKHVADSIRKKRPAPLAMPMHPNPGQPFLPKPSGARPIVPK